jgi:hypothetical protein
MKKSSKLKLLPKLRSKTQKQTLLKRLSNIDRLRKLINRGKYSGLRNLIGSLVQKTTSLFQVRTHNRTKLWSRNI